MWTPPIIAVLPMHLLRQWLPLMPRCWWSDLAVTGKTTSAQRLAASSLKLADGKVASALASDPAAVLKSREQPVLIDEWQIVPECLNAVKELVDSDNRRGQFIVTGSVRGDLDSPTWPGTGRLVRLPMFGLTEREIEGRIDGPGWFERVLSGERFGGYWSDDNVRTYVERALRSGFPEAALQLEDPFRHQWLTSYVDQLITRDAAQVDNGRDPDRLRRYMTALALNSAAVVDDATLWEAARINKASARCLRPVVAQPSGHRQYASLDLESAQAAYPRSQALSRRQRSVCWGAGHNSGRCAAGRRSSRASVGHLCRSATARRTGVTHPTEAALTPASG